MFGLFIILGMVFIVGSIDVFMNMGILVGLVFVFLVVFFVIFNKKYIWQFYEMGIIFLELGSVWFFFCLVLLFYLFFLEIFVQMLLVSLMDWGYFLVLFFFCIMLVYVFVLCVFNYFMAFVFNFMVNLELVYGILLAWILLWENEELILGFYLGGMVILLVVFSYLFIWCWCRKRGLEVQFLGLG